MNSTRTRKIALVTGANRGIGLAAARRFARDGDHVIVTARTAEAGERIAEQLTRDGHSASSLAMDVTDLAQVRAAAVAIDARFGRLDVLVNNAGILPEATASGSPEAVDLAMFQQTYATNVFGPVAVLEAFLPLLRKSLAGRIVNVSSTMGSLADQTDPKSPYYAMHVPAYQSSKAALNNVTVALAKSLGDTPIKITSVCPGWVQTDLAPGNREQAPVTPDEAAAVIYAAARLPESAASGTFVDANGAVPW